jgi:iron complex outermembrane receptor protein
MITKREIFLIVLFCFAVSAITAQPVIKGTVTDKQTGETLVGVNIFLPDYSKGAVSDKNGNYILKGLHKGEVIVNYSFMGYKTVIKKVKIDDRDITLDIAMKPAVIQGEEVVVTGTFAGSQHENVMKISTMNPRQFLQSGSPSFIEAMKEIPGVDIISKGPGVGTPVIRGLSLSNILFLNNGIPMQNFQFSENHPFMVDANGAERVEVIKGPASLLYGSGAVGGVINIIKKPPLPEGKIAGDFETKFYSNTNGFTSSLGVSGTNNGISWGAAGGLSSNMDYYDGNNSRVPNSRFNRENAKLNVGLIKPNGSFRLFYDYNRDKPGLTVKPALGLVTENGRKNEVWYQDLTNHLFSMINKIFVGAVKIDMNLAYQMNKRKLQGSELTPVFTLVDMSLNTFSYRASATVPFGDKVKFIGGIQGMNQENRNFDAPDHVVPDAVINDFSLFAVGQFNISGKFMLETGLRYDYRNINVPGQNKSVPSDPEMIEPFANDYNNVSGSVGSVYSVNDKMHFRINFASAFRSPNLAELTQDGMHGTRYEQGNRDLKSQQSLEGDLSFHLHTDHTTFDISGFYNDIFNYIHLSPTTDTTSEGVMIYKYDQQNSFLYGGEVLLHFHPHPLDWLHIKGTWAYVVGKTEEGDHLPFIPAQKVNVEIEFQKKKWKGLRNLFLRVNSDFVLEQNKPAPSEIMSPSYTLLNCGIGTQVKAAGQLLTIGLFANNILDEVYIDHLSTLKDLGMNNMGRNFTISVKVPFGLKN